MQILKTTTDNLVIASQILADGGLVAYPTDTVYGLGCTPFNVKALKRLFKVKGERDKPLPILASDVESIEKIAFLSGKARKIAARFWPGSLTLVLPKKPA
ncbi:MAG: Sua5/YciO/YrdC/YwlC family protein, partial [Candidatus Bathyarchaeota archaeon]